MERKAGRLARFVRAIGDSAVYVGIDVHKKTYSVALFCPDRNLTEGYVCPADEAGLAEQLRGLGCVIVHVVYESGPTGFSLARRLIDAGFCASVVAASRIPRVSAAAAKTDRIDAAKLAIYSARGLLHAIAPRRFPRRWRFPSSPDEPSRASPQGSAMRQEQPFGRAGSGHWLLRMAQARAERSRRSLPARFPAAPAAFPAPQPTVAPCCLPPP